MNYYQIDDQETQEIENGSVVEVGENQVIYFKDGEGQLIQPSGVLPSGEDLIVTIENQIIVLEGFLREPSQGQSPPEIAGFFADGTALDQDDPLLQEAIAIQENEGEGPAFTLLYRDPNGGISVDVIPVDLLVEISETGEVGIGGSIFDALLGELGSRSFLLDLLASRNQFQFGGDDEGFIEPNVLPEITIKSGDLAEGTVRESDSGL
ncbi:MAG: hypothetical protein AAF357_03065, partial [Verrucomicrobiota bacterium]